MKAKNLFLGILFLIPALFTSCELEQTSLNVDAIKGQATIKGRVLYNAGKIQNGNYVNEIWKAAKGQTIFAYIDNADLTGNAAATGQTVYSAKLDSAGNYELDLPATTTGFNVTLSLSNFEGNFSTYNGVNTTNGTVNYQEAAGFYTSGSKVQYIKNTFNYVVDFGNYIFTSRDILNNLTAPEFVKVSGKMTYVAEVRNIDSTSVVLVGKPAVGRKVLVVNEGTYYSAVSKSTMIGDTEMAVYEFYLPLKFGSSNTLITLIPASYEGSYTTYIKNGLKYNSSNTLKGKFYCNPVSQNILLDKGMTSYINTTLNYVFNANPDYAQ